MLKLYKLSVGWKNDWKEGQERLINGYEMCSLKSFTDQQNITDSNHFHYLYYLNDRNQLGQKTEARDVVR